MPALSFFNQHSIRDEQKAADLWVLTFNGVTHVPPNVLMRMLTQAATAWPISIVLSRPCATFHLSILAIARPLGASVFSV
jgi:hypothetical protein